MFKRLEKIYFSPTPKKWRKIGDALLAVSTLMTTYAIADDLKWIAISSLFLGSIGKFLTNFFTEE